MARPINITLNCPKCEASVRTDVSLAAAEFACPACKCGLRLPADAVENGQLTRCLVCPSTELFIRKDFPQRLGVAIVTLGFAASSVAWYYHELYITFGILFATALIDVVLYALVGESLVCYRCHAEYRFLELSDRYAAFNLETHERYRQQAARMPAASPPPRDVPAA